MKSFIGVVLVFLFFIFPAQAQLVVGDAFRITASLSSPSGQRKPKVAFDGTDTYLVVWEEGANVWQNSVTQIYAARIQNISGTLTVLDPSGIHLAPSNNTQEAPKVVYGGGVFLVVWQELSGSTDYDIKGITVTSTLTISNAISICNQSNNQVDPDVTYDSVNSRFFAVWSDFRGRTAYQIYGAPIGINGSIGTAVQLVDKEYHYCCADYDFAIYRPSIQTNGQKLILSFGEKSRTLNDRSDLIVKYFDLSGSLLSTVIDSSSTKILYCYPNSFYTYPLPMATLTDGMNFLILYRALDVGALSRTNAHFLVQTLQVQSNGAMPSSCPAYADSNNYAIAASGLYAEPFYYLFWEGISDSVDNYSVRSFAGANHNIYGSRVSKDGLTMIDSSIPISAGTTQEYNPAAAKGIGAEMLIVYEEDNGTNWVLKGRRLTTNVNVTTPESDFAARCAAPGVLLCEGFDSQSALDWNGSVGAAGKGFFWNQGGGPSPGPNQGTLDNNIKVSGGGSLRFNIPDSRAPEGSGNAGQYRQPFGASFGEGSTFYIQWRMRFSPEMLALNATNTGGGQGYKQIIVHNNGATCAATELTFTNNYFANFPTWYTSCGARSVINTLPGNTYQYEQGDYAACIYPGNLDSTHCWFFTANEWITFYWKVQIGTWGQPNSHLQAWAARGSGPLQMIFDKSDMQLDSSGDYNYLTLTPYMNRRAENGTPTHPQGYVWYDELVVSSQPIPNPKIR